MKDILAFQGDHRWLSNFWPSTVILDGDIFPTVENAYQAAKVDKSMRKGFINIAPGAAKKLGRSIEIRDNWDNLKLDVMRGLIQQKFASGTPLAVKLKATGTCLIAEGNTWGDTFWGVCNGRGLNMLGKLIMAQREKL